MLYEINKYKTNRLILRKEKCKKIVPFKFDRFVIIKNKKLFQFNNNLNTNLKY